MSEQMPHDDELRELYRRLPPDEPRAEVDDAILSAARASASRAGGAHESRTTLLRRIRWAVPLAAAAGVVLTFALMRLAPEQRMEGLDESSGRSAATEERASSQLSPQGEVPEDSAGMLAAEPVPRDGDAAGASSKDERSRMAGASGQAEVRERADKTNEDDSADASIRSEAIGRGVEPKASNRVQATDRMAGRTRPIPAPAQRGAGGASDPDTADRGVADAPAAPPPAALAGRNEEQLADSTRARQAPVAQATPEPKGSVGINGFAAKSAPEAETAGAVAVSEWPFALRPGVDAEEACRGATKALRVPCEFRGDQAVLDLPRGASIDRGTYSGRMITRLTMRLRDDRLHSIALRMQGEPEEVVLTAPN